MKTRLNSNLHRCYKIPSLPVYWENYLLSIVLHLLLPLLPIGMECLLTGKVTERSLTLAASMYSISIGVSSKSRLMFGITIMVSLIFAAIFGYVAKVDSSQNAYGPYAVATIVAVFIVHTAERYNRHVVDRAPFFQFMRDGGNNI